MIRRIRMAIAIGGIAVLLGGTAALATPPSGLTSTLLARGSLSRHDRIQLLAGLTQHIKPRSSDVAMAMALVAGLAMLVAKRATRRARLGPVA